MEGEIADGADAVVEWADTVDEAVEIGKEALATVELVDAMEVANGVMEGADLGHGANEGSMEFFDAIEVLAAKAVDGVFETATAGVGSVEVGGAMEITIGVVEGAVEILRLSEVAFAVEVTVEGAV